MANALTIKTDGVVALAAQKGLPEMIKTPPEGNPSV